MSSNSNSESFSPPSKRPRICEIPNGLAEEVKNGVSLMSAVAFMKAYISFNILM